MELYKNAYRNDYDDPHALNAEFADAKLAYQPMRCLLRCFKYGVNSHFMDPRNPGVCIVDLCGGISCSNAAAKALRKLCYAQERPEFQLLLIKHFTVNLGLSVVTSPMIPDFLGDYNFMMTRWRRQPETRVLRGRMWVNGGSGINFLKDMCTYESAEQARAVAKERQDEWDEMHACGLSCEKGPPLLKLSRRRGIELWEIVRRARLGVLWKVVDKWAKVTFKPKSDPDGVVRAPKRLRDEYETLFSM